MREDELHVEDCVPGCVVLAQAHPWPWWAAVVARHPDTGDFKDTKNRRWIYFFNDTNGSWQYPRKMMRFTPFNVEHMLEINERFKRNHQVKDRIEGSLQLAREFLQGEVAPTENLQRFNANLTPNSIADEESNQLAPQNGNVNGNGVMYDEEHDEVEQMDGVDEGEQTAEEEVDDDEREDGNAYNTGITTEDEDGQEGDLVGEEGNEEGDEDNVDQPHAAIEETLEEGRMDVIHEQQQQDDDENDAMDVDAEPEEDEQKSEDTTPKKRSSQASDGSGHTETDVPRNVGVSHAEVVGVVNTDEKKGSEGAVEQEQEDTRSPTDVTKPVEDANGEAAADPSAPQTAQASNADEAISGIRHRSKRKRMKSTKLAGFVDPTVSTRQRRSIRTKSKVKGNDNTSSPGMTPEQPVPSHEVTMEEADETAKAKQDIKKPWKIRLKLAVTPEGVRTVRKMRAAGETNEIEPDDAVVIDNLDEEVAQVLASETQKRTMLTRAQVAAAEAAEKNVEGANDEEIEEDQTDEIENQNITSVGGKLKIKVKRNALKESVFQRVKAVKGKGKQVPGVARGGVSKRGAKVGIRLPTRQTPPRKARAAAAAASAAQAASQARARGKAKTVTPVATKKRKQVAARGSKRLGTDLQEDQVQIHVPAPEQPPPVAVTRPRKRPRTHLTSYRAPVQLAAVHGRENEGEIETESENDEDVERLRRAFIDPGDNQQVAEMNVQLANRVAVLEDHMKRVIERQDAEEPKKATGASMAAVQLKTAAQMLQVAAQAFARENDFDPERTARALDMVWPDEEVRPKGFVSQNVMVASKSIVWDEQTKGRYRKQAREKQRQKEAQEKRDREEMANLAAN